MPRLTAVAVAALVVVASGLPRVLLAAGQLPDALRPFVWSDALLTYTRGLSGHRLPYIDTPFEYPPLTAAIAAVLSLAAPNAATFVAGWTVVLAVAAAVAAFALASAAGVRRTIAYWSLAPQLVLLSGVNFDVLPVCFLTLAAIAQRSGMELRAAAALAAGVAAKLYPLAAVPIAIARDRRRVAGVVVIAAVLGLFYAPTILQQNSSGAGVAFYAVGIGANVDSFWGLVQGPLDGTGLPGRSAILVITAAGLAISYLFGVFPRAMRARDAAWAFALATVVLLFWSRLYSPQYSLWVIAFFALVPIGTRLFVLLTAADVGVFLTIYPLTLVSRAGEDPSTAILLAALATSVTLRQVALLLCWRRLSRLCDSSLKDS